MKPKHLLLLGIVAVIVFFYFNKKYVDKVNKRGLADLNLVMTGVVDSVDKLNGYNGTGIIKLKILTSNVKYYDPRRRLDYYYCIIKNGKAEVYDGNANECFKGDTVKIDTRRKLISWLNKGKENQKYSIWINTNDKFYRYIKTHHQKLYD